VNNFRDDEKWVRRFYAEIYAVADVLFVKAKTTQGAKRLLREMREEWASQLTRVTSDADGRAWALLANWCNQTDNYWQGLFHCYADPRIPATNNDMEHLIKEMKQLERVLSRNPNPAIRFILHAATNALVTGRPSLPGADYLARCGADAMHQAETRLRADRKRRGVGWRAIRNFKDAKVSLLERWKLACDESKTDETRSTGEAHAS